ncbi:MAG: hypothetical protein JWN59_804, partial [Sphingomonas bacterium]|nr:hypothetical protein [Sphingomonas bacterium]
RVRCPSHAAVGKVSTVRIAAVDGDILVGVPA